MSRNTYSFDKSSAGSAIESLHRRLIDLCAEFSEEELRRQYHADLSPLGWHLAHVAFIEQYWLREVILGDHTRTAGQHTQFFPELIDKVERSELESISDLPGIEEVFTETESLLHDLVQAGHPHPLLERNYIGWFLLQHGEQHYETMQMVIHQRVDKEDLRVAYTAKPLAPVEPSKPDLVFAADECNIGCDAAYARDNEQPVHTVKINPFSMASAPVTNAEYLGFIESDGYENTDYWSAAGWQWRVKAEPEAPEYWRKDSAGNWYRMCSRGAIDLKPDDPVSGLSWFEADAFARYASCRLPHELEWESAMQPGVAGPGDSLWSTTGRVWEWCANTFYPYRGFTSFPYERYSRPWFDGGHYSLRGSSPYTGLSVRHPAFRNFYQPDKRHIFAGVRLAADT